MREGDFPVAINDEVTPADAFNNCSRSDEVATRLVRDVSEDGFSGCGVDVIASFVAGSRRL